MSLSDDVVYIEKLDEICSVAFIFELFLHPVIFTIKGSRSA